MAMHTVPVAIPRGWSFRVVATLAALAFPIGAAWGDSSHLHGNVNANSTTGMQQTIDDMPVAALPGLDALDNAGNHATAGGSLAGPTGSISLTAHACSGGGPTFGGLAISGSDARFSADYLIVSSTLSAGTPVQVKFRWSTSALPHGIAQNPSNVNDAGQSGAAVQIGVVMPIGNVYDIFGSVERSGSSGGFGLTLGGTFNPEAGSNEATLTVLVGQWLRINLQCSVNASTYAISPASTDGDVQFVIVWGVSSMNPDAAAVLASNPAEPAPPAEMATPEDAVQRRPPRPEGPDILPCFRIPSPPVSATVCAGDNPTLSVGVLGTGPFTYRWRKNGVPVDSDLNPSATTTMLELPGVSPADAGSYDCVVTNPCGDIVSAPAMLTVDSPPMISQQPAPATICPNGSAPFAATASGSEPLSYQWQVLTAPEFWMTMGNDPGPLPCGGGAFSYAAPINSPTVSIGIRPCPGIPGAPQHFQVRCLVSNACGTAYSNSAAYTICPADFNCSGTLEVADIFAFLNAWFAGDPNADFDGASGLQVADIFAFLNAWFAGC